MPLSPASSSPLLFSHLLSLRRLKARRQFYWPSSAAAAVPPSALHPSGGAVGPCIALLCSAASDHRLVAVSHPIWHHEMPSSALLCCGLKRRPRGLKKAADGVTPDCRTQVRGRSVTCARQTRPEWPSGLVLLCSLIGVLLFQDALVHLAGVISFAEFQEAVARAITIVVPNSVCDFLLLLRFLKKILLKDYKCWSSLHSSKTCEISALRFRIYRARSQICGTNGNSPISSIIIRVLDINFWFR